MVGVSAPNQLLLDRYRTDGVFAKLAAIPFVSPEQMAMGLLNFLMVRKNRDLDEQQELENVLRREATRELEASRMQQANGSLQHTRVPMLLPAGSNVPAGWDEGMVRLASIAAGAGADLAKEGGIGFSIAKSVGQIAKPFALPALAVGGLMAAGAGGRAVARQGMKENPPPAYGMGTPTRGVGYQIPFGTNGYGQPQVGTPL